MTKGLYAYSFKTEGGCLRLWATRKGLYALEWGEEKSVPSRGKKPIPHRIHSLLRRAASRVRTFLGGKKADFGSLPIDWSGCRGFEKQVLQELRRVPWGRTASYQLLAEKAGRPKAARTVGRILHFNRLPLVIPCHRIVPKKGGLGGFSQGPRLKRHLLKLEERGVDKKTERKWPV